MNRLLILLFLLINIELHAQKYIGKKGEISFFSEAPLENIAAINNKVSAAFDAASNDLVFQLKISDFIFPKALMQEHFNENYLESDIYPNSTFVGRVIDNQNGKAIVQGDLTIHGVTNKIRVQGIMRIINNTVHITADLIIKLEDYNIPIPKIVMYKIAEEIDINIDIKLEKIK